MQKKEKILVTSALPYANGPLHLGHLAGAYLPADIFVRYHRLKGSDIVYICGSDEHGVPITLRAEVENTTPQRVVDKYHKILKKSFDKIGIDFDNYSRTTLPLHHKTSQDFFLKIYKKGIFKTKIETQLYCETCERFLPDRFVEGKCPSCKSIGARGDQCEKCGTWLDPLKLIDPQCKLCGSIPIVRQTEHLYIPLGQFQKQLEEWILPKKDWKDNVLNYCRGWFKQGLEDRAVTRDLDWGVPVPLKEYSSKVLYVWFDAPIGYISSTKEWAEKQGNPDLWKEYWCNPETKIYHFIGKDNIVFHAIFFPVILIAYGGFNLPENVVANEFLTIESRKISTSQNYAVWVDDYLKAFPPDPLRYFLATISPETKDADFSWLEFQAKTNNELADTLGNFINRALVFIERNFGGTIPKPQTLSSQDTEILQEVEALIDTVATSIETFRIKSGILCLMDAARKSNKYFNDNEPWETIKKNPPECAAALYVSVQIIKFLALGMMPYMPFSAQKVVSFLNCESEFESKTWEEIKTYTIPSGRKIKHPEILFEKIEDSVIQTEIDKLNVLAQGAEKAPVKEQKPIEEREMEPITIEDFKKLDLKIAQIKSVSKVPNTEKLYKLEVFDGSEVRFIISGIAGDYTMEELTGKLIVLLANLKPAKIRGEISNGMLLAATTDNGGIALLQPDKNIKPGCRIS